MAASWLSATIIVDGPGPALGNDGGRYDYREPIVITERGIPVLRLVPYRKDPCPALQALRGTVVKYQSATEPVGEDWEIAR